MKELFKKQLEREIPLTFETLGNSQNQKYYNGEHKTVGDVVLFAILFEGVKETEETDDTPELQLKLIQLNEKHFDLFEPYSVMSNGPLPHIKLK